MRQVPFRGGLLLLLLLLSAAAPRTPDASSAAGPPGSPPPTPRPVPHEDKAQGVSIADEFRWMETAGPSLDAWIDAEDAYARATLSALPGRSKLRGRVHELWTTGVADEEEVIDRRAGRTLVLDWTLDRGRLMARDKAGTVRLLHDPQSTSVEVGASVIRASTRISPDGKHAAVGFVERGQASPRIRIVDLVTGRWLPEVLAPPLWADAEGFQVAWSDAQHLLWVRNPRRTAETPEGEREFHGHLFLHRIGTPPVADVAVFGTSLNDEVAPEDTPYPTVSADGRWWLVLLRRPAGRALWAARAGGGKDSRFREVLRTDTVFRGFGARDGRLWAVVAEGPRHRLVRIALEEPGARPELVLDGERLPRGGVLSGLAVASDGVWFGRRDGATSSLWRLAKEGRETVPVRLPRPGLMADLQPGPDGSGARLRLQSALQVDEWLVADSRGAAARPESPAAASRPAGSPQHAVSIVEAPARDGVLVPVTLLHRRDAPRSGGAFVRMHVYGCYGAPMDPFFDPANAAWLERGGIVAFAHVRGGADKGRDWHQAATARGRATASEDAADIAEHLVRSGWTRPGRIALTGESCGAATVGNAALMRPELFAAAALIVGGVDEWRGWSETASGARSVRDLGDPATDEGVRRMVAASPYHRLLPGVRRPAFFLFNGGTDYTVPLWMGAKFVARARTTAGEPSAPVLFRVERDAGHAGPADIGVRADVYADELAFMLWNMGHPDFQPRH